jgi:tetratricopeptide (TPR) repeat protein
MEAYQAAGIRPCNEKIAVCAAVALERPSLLEAIEAFRAAGIDPPTEQLVARASVSLQAGSVASTVRVFQALGVNDIRGRLIAYGKDCIARGMGYSGNALEAFEAAGDAESLVACGNLWLARGEVGIALQAFIASRAPNLTTQFLECAHESLKRGWTDFAINAFARAGARNDLVRLGDSLLERGRLGEAVDAFRAAGLEPSKEKLVACGLVCLESFREHGRRAFD